MKKLQLLSLFCCLTIAASAQVNTYTFSSSAGTYTPLGSGTALVPPNSGLSGTGWEAQVFNIGLPFVYYFNGKGYSSCYISSDGYIAFGAPINPGTAWPLQAANGQNGVICAFGNDAAYAPGSSLVDAQNANPIIYNTIGSAPNRIFVVQWTAAMRSVTFFGSGTNTGETITFQIRMYETTNVAEIVYNTSSTNQTNTYYPMVGIGGASTADFVALGGTTWAGATASTSSNTKTITFNSTTSIPAGTTYDFTPPAALMPAACSGTPSGMAALSTQGVTCGSVTLSLSNLPLSTGLTYQWETSQTGQPGSWTFVSGATNATYTTSPTFATFYQCLVACGAGTQVASSSVVVGYESSCPALPSYSIQTSSFNSTYIASFSIAGGTCGTTLSDATVHVPNYGYITYGGASGTAYVYGDLDYEPTHIKLQGSATVSTTFNATLVSTNANSAVANVWIDFNDNGTFADVAAEKVGTATAITAAGKTIVLTIPANSFGVHRMRIRTAFSGSYTTATLPPTGLIAANGVGEARDYVIEITPPPGTVNGSLSGTICVPPTQADVLTATSITGETPVTYTWTGPNSYAATTNTNTTSLSVSAVAQNGTYSVVTTADGASACTAGTLFVSVATATSAPTAEPTAITMTPTATGGTLNFTPNASVPSGYLVVVSTSSTAPTAPTSGTYYATGAYPPGGAGSPVVVAASASTGNAPSFAVAGLTSNTQYYAYLYPFNVSCTGAQYEAPATTSFVTCVAAPGTPTSSAVTSTSMTVSWTAAATGGGFTNPINYQLNAYYDAALSIPIPGFPVSMGTALTYNATGLTPGTYYYFTVTALGSCNTTSGALKITTSCATPASLPWLQTFENNPGATLNLSPNCMTGNGDAGIYNVVPFNGITNHTSGGTWYYLYQGNYFSNSTTYANQWLITPQFTMQAGTTYTLSFWYLTDGSNWPSIKAEYSTTSTIPARTANDMTGFTSIGAVTNISNITYQHFLQTFTVPVTGNYTIGIDVQMGAGTVGTIGATSNYDLAIDDIEICGAPSGTPGNNGPICASATPQTVVLSANTTNATNAATYAWNGAGSFTSSSVSSPSVTSTYSVPGTSIYSVSIVNDPVIYGYGGYCSVTNATDNLAINQLATSAAPTSAPTVACIGGTITLTGNVTGGTGNVYAWSGPTTGIVDATQQNTTIPLAVPANAGIYTLTVTAPGCTGSVTGNTSAAPEVVNSLPTSVSPAVSPNPVCVNSTISLNGNVIGGSGLSYSWTGPTTGITSASVANATIPNASTLNAGTYTLTVTAAGCVSSISGNTNATPLVVNILPTTVTASVTPNPVCAGNAVTLMGGNTGGTGLSFSWAGPVTGHIVSASSENAGITSAALTDAGTYTLTATAAGCTGSTVGMSSSLTVNQLPSLITASVTPNPACVSGAVTLTGGNTGGSGVIYSWAGPVTGHIVSASSESTGITSAALADAGVYTLTATAPACTGSTVGMSSSLVVNQLPSLVTASVTPNPVCVSSGITLTGTNTGGSGVVYAWAGPVTGHIVSSSSESTSITSAALTDAGTYTLTATAPGCAGSTVGKSSSLIVNQLPSLITASVTPNPACVNGTLTLTGGNTGGSGVIYSWAGPVTGHIVSASSESTGITSAALADAGVYTLTATAPACTGSTAGMSSSLVVNQLPSLVTASVTPNPVCVNSAITLMGSNTSGTGVQYSWAGPSSGHISSASSESTGITSAALSDAGTYTLTATAPGCAGSTVGRSSSIIVNQLPSAVTASVTPNPVCVGNAVTLIGGNTSGTGVLYSWAGPSTGHISSASSESTGITTAALTDAGVYTLTATAPGCAGSTVGNSSSLVVHVLPTSVSASATPNPACVGGTISITGGDSGDGVGVNYAWTGPVTGDIVSASSESTTITSAVTADAGVYTLTATSVGCAGSTVANSSALVVNTPPASVSPVTSPNPICVSFPITLTGNVVGGTALSYSWSGPITGIVNASAVNTTIPSASLANNGTYTLTVTAAGCAPVSGNTSANQQVVNALPDIHTFTGGGAYCFGDTGVHAGLTLSQAGVSYQLYRNPSTAVGSPVLGTGAAIDFGLLTVPGVYYAIATNISTNCTSYLSGITVYINPLPTVYSVTGGGSYCLGGAGDTVGLAGSDVGISYQLYNNGSPVGAPLAGTGGSLNFGYQTLAGPYTVIATNAIVATHCTQSMDAGTGISVNIIPLPGSFTLTGGGSYCAADTGVHIGLSGSESGISYQLYYNSSPVGSVVTGTGSALDFGLMTAGGVYSAIATNTVTTCAAMMSNSLTVTVNPMPAVFDVTGGGGYCSGFAGAVVGLSGSASGINYQLYLGSGTVGSVVNGTGSPISFGPIATAGVYTVTAIDATTGCASPMTDSAVVTINPVLTPIVHISTGVGDGDTVCLGSMITFTAQTQLGGAAPGYVWFVNGGVVSTTDSTYSYVPNAGDIIKVQLTSDTVCAIPNPVVDSMNIQLQAPLVPSVFIFVSPILSIDPGQRDTLTAVATNCGPSPSYQWYLNGSLITGATNATYTSGIFNNHDSVSCRVTTSGPCGGRITYNSVIITVYSTGVTQVGSLLTDVRLIPNPNTGTFVIKGSLGTTDDEPVSIEITDMIGQVIYSDKTMANGGMVNKQIQLSSTLANGMYMLNLVSGTDHKVFHFVIEQ